MTEDSKKPGEVVDDHVASAAVKLAAAGLTNRQVAEQSFLSPKTVEANLARVYRKLGITSRAELGAHMANEGRSRTGPSPGT